MCVFACACERVCAYCSPFLPGADAHHLLQPVATNGQYSNARVQPIMIKKLAGV